MLNRFPSTEHGFSDTVPPAELIDGLDKLDFSTKGIFVCLCTNLRWQY